MKCNGCGTEMIQKDETHWQCPKCPYSFSDKPAVPSKGSKYTQEVNKTIKQLLVEARLDDSPAPWQKQYVIIPKRNYDSGHEYQGTNRWLLSCDPEISYITLSSIEKRGLKLVEDAKTRLVIAWVPPHLSVPEKKLSPSKQDELMKKRFPFMITKHVYRAKDVEGLEPKTYEGDKENKRFNSIEEFIKSTGINLIEGGNRPLYFKSRDAITVPRIEQYNSSEEYYRDLFHELVHWTGGKTRLNRDVKKYQAEKDYGREQLIAEMGAGYLCQYFGIGITENSVAYIDQWLKAIDGDANLLVSAAQSAEKVLTFFKLND